jgi:hypothetical protein
MLERIETASGEHEAVSELRFGHREMKWMACKAAGGGGGQPHDAAGYFQCILNCSTVQIFEVQG